MGAQKITALPLQQLMTALLVIFLQLVYARVFIEAN